LLCSVAAGESEVGKVALNSRVQRTDRRKPLTLSYQHSKSSQWTSLSIGHRPGTEVVFMQCRLAWERSKASGLTVACQRASMSLEDRRETRTRVPQFLAALPLGPPLSGLWLVAVSSPKLRPLRRVVKSSVACVVLVEKKSTIEILSSRPKLVRAVSVDMGHNRM
jgi:hypothetical protein